MKNKEITISPLLGSYNFLKVSRRNIQTMHNLVYPMRAYPKIILWDLTLILDKLSNVARNQTNKLLCQSRTGMSNLEGLSIRENAHTPNRFLWLWEVIHNNNLRQKTPDTIKLRHPQFSLGLSKEEKSPTKSLRQCHNQQNRHSLVATGDYVMCLNWFFCSIRDLDLNHDIATELHCMIFCCC